jgi:hypothetical protein
VRGKNAILDLHTCRSSGGALWLSSARPITLFRNPQDFHSNSQVHPQVPIAGSTMMMLWSPRPPSALAYPEISDGPSFPAMRLTSPYSARSWTSPPTSSAAAWPIAAACVFDLAGGAAIAQTRSTILSDVSPSDPSTYIAVATVLSMVAAMSALAPVRRATRIDPLVALRVEQAVITP